MILLDLIAVAKPLRATVLFQSQEVSVQAQIHRSTSGVPLHLHRPTENKCFQN